MEYEIIYHKQFKQWITKNTLLAKSLEKLIKVHRKEKLFNLSILYKESNNFKIIILYKINECIGFGRSQYNNNKYLISIIHIDKKYRGKGLCKFMIHKLVSSYPPMSNFIVYVKKNNISAIHCYEFNGFIIKNEIKNEYQMELKTIRNI